MSHLVTQLFSFSDINREWKRNGQRLSADPCWDRQHVPLLPLQRKKHFQVKDHHQGWELGLPLGRICTAVPVSLAAGVAKLCLWAGLLYGTVAKSLPEGCGRRKGEGFSIGIFHQEGMFAGRSLDHSRTFGCQGCCLEVLGITPEHSEAVWNIKFWAICQRSEVLTEFFLSVCAGFLPLVSSKGLHFLFSAARERCSL